MATILTGFLYLFGIFFIVVGALSVFATDMIRKKFFNKLLELKDLKKYAPLSIIIGVLLLFSVPYNRHRLLILLFGILSMAKGILLLVAPEKIEKYKNWWQKAKDNAYRACGIVIIIIGSIVLMGI
ncbi:MAG: hypothetical protein NG740_04690 [Omnitrophica bacterium]|nr:hypothetical protein [Candidatus Omnitrophota bacterium]